MNEVEKKSLDRSELGASCMHMKSLMKSFSNGNFQFYENLHMKYFDKAKEKSHLVNSKPPTTSSVHQTSENILTLSSKTGTILGLSQLKQSIDSLKFSKSRMVHDKSMLHASSLNEPVQNKSSDRQ